MIEATGLRKTFGGFVAVDGLDLEVRPGEVLGFLGPNGAGKSTSMRMITGYLEPTAGRVTVGGIDVASDPVRTKAQIGYLPESAPGYGELTVQEFLRFSAEIRGLRGRAKRGGVERAIGRCFLERVRHQTVATLSKGFRHRTCLAQSMVHDPPVLVMDEPTDGLDPNQKHEIRTLIRAMGADKAIVFSTHILEEVEAVCDRAILIDRGRLVADGTPDALRAKTPGAGELVVAVGGVNADAAAAAWRELPGVAGVAAEGDAFRLRPAAGVDVRSVAAAVAADVATRGWPLHELRVTEGRLDRFFRSVTTSDAVDDVCVTKAAATPEAAA